MNKVKVIGDKYKEALIEERIKKIGLRSEEVYEIEINENYLILIRLKPRIIKKKKWATIDAEIEFKGPEGKRYYLNMDEESLVYFQMLLNRAVTSVKAARNRIRQKGGKKKWRKK